MQSRRSADHAKMVQVKSGSGQRGAFKIPIQACEKIEDSDYSGDNEPLSAVNKD